MDNWPAFFVVAQERVPPVFYVLISSVMPLSTYVFPMDL